MSLNEKIKYLNMIFNCWSRFSWLFSGNSSAPKKIQCFGYRKNKILPNDKRTLAVNANSRDFLKNLGIWKELKSNFESIDKIMIKDYVNKDDLIFHNTAESMGSVVFNRSLLKISRDYLKRNKILLTDIDFKLSNHNPKKIVSINSKKYFLIK